MNPTAFSKLKCLASQSNWIIQRGLNPSEVLEWEEQINKFAPTNAHDKVNRKVYRFVNKARSQVLFEPDLVEVLNSFKVWGMNKSRWRTFVSRYRVNGWDEECPLTFAWANKLSGGNGRSVAMFLDQFLSDGIKPYCLYPPKNPLDRKLVLFRHIDTQYSHDKLVSLIQKCGGVVTTRRFQTCDIIISAEPEQYGNLKHGRKAITYAELQELLRSDVN